MKLEFRLDKQITSNDSLLQTENKDTNKCTLSLRISENKQFKRTTRPPHLQQHCTEGSKRHRRLNSIEGIGRYHSRHVYYERLLAAKSLCRYFYPIVTLVNREQGIMQACATRKNRNNSDG